jgi:diguanylate cyclase (GGDEF)-like protein
MPIQTTTFALLALVAAWTSSVVAARVGPRRREAPGARPLFWLLIAVTVWSAGAAIELSVSTLPFKLLWSKIQYLGTLPAPPLFLVFASRLSRSSWTWTRKRLAALFALPALTLLAALTNELHGLVWPAVSMAGGESTLAVFGRGPMFWIGVVGFSYLCLAAGSVQLTRGALSLPRALRRQAVVALVAVGIPWVTNASYIFGFFPVRGLDPTPLSIAAMGVVCGVAVLGFGLVDLLPEARAAIVRGMSAGLLVFDEDDRLIDLNPAARHLLGDAELAIGAPWSQVAAHWPGLATGRDEQRQICVEVLAPGEPTRALEVEISRLEATHGGPDARIVQIHDVSERRRAALELVRANQELRRRLGEIEQLQESLREQAVRDPLTGVFNRRYLDETLAREFARAERAAEPIAVVLLDLDRFKELNDRLGHAAGDEVLRALGALIRARTRKADIACRLGGDEFLIAMPGTDRAAALLRAEDLVETFAVRFARATREGISCTLSAGVAAWPADATSLESLLASADLALYAAKAAGRNRVAVPD